MCGATHEQKETQTAQDEFFKEGIKQQQIVFGQDQEILKAITDTYKPILVAGPNQRGFNDEERNTYNTQIAEGTAKNYTHAAEALGENLGALGGGDDYLPTGGSAVLRGKLATSAAQEQSSEELGVKQADYAKGYDQWKQAGQGMAVASGQLSPTAYSGAATGAGVASANTANQIASQSNSWVNAALGAAGAIGAGYAGRG